MQSLYDVIKRPIISEKSTMLTEMSNSYVFEVPTRTNKLEIRQAVEMLFNVKVESVKTLIVHGIYKRTQKSVVKKPNWKKAIVTLKEGNKIQFFQGV